MMHHYVAKIRKNAGLEAKSKVCGWIEVEGEVEVKIEMDEHGRELKVSVLIAWFSCISMCMRAQSFCARDVEEAPL